MRISKNTSAVYASGALAKSIATLINNGEGMFKKLAQWIDNSVDKPAKYKIQLFKDTDYKYLYMEILPAKNPPKKPEMVYQPEDVHRANIQNESAQSSDSEKENKKDEYVDITIAMRAKNETSGKYETVDNSTYSFTNIPFSGDSIDKAIKDYLSKHKSLLAPGERTGTYYAIYEIPEVSSSQHIAYVTVTCSEDASGKTIYANDIRANYSAVEALADAEDLINSDTVQLDQLDTPCEYMLLPDCEDTVIDITDISDDSIDEFVLDPENNLRLSFVVIRSILQDIQGTLDSHSSKEYYMLDSIIWAVDESEDKLMYIINREDGYSSHYMDIELILAGKTYVTDILNRLAECTSVCDKIDRCMSELIDALQIYSTCSNTEDDTDVDDALANMLSLFTHLKSANAVLCKE